jgi:hypothetical protein
MPKHTEGDGVEKLKAVCKLGLEGIVSKKVDADGQIFRAPTAGVWGMVGDGAGNY